MENNSENSEKNNFSILFLPLKPCYPKFVLND